MAVRRGMIGVASLALTALAWFMPTGATREQITATATATVATSMAAPLKTALTGYSGGEVGQMILTQADLEKLDFLLDPLGYYGDFWCPAGRNSCLPAEMTAVPFRGNTDVDNPNDSTLVMGLRPGGTAFERIEYEASNPRAPQSGLYQTRGGGDGLGTATFNRFGLAGTLTNTLAYGGIMEPFRFALKKIAGPLIFLFMMLNFATVMIVGAMGGGTVGLDKVLQQTVFRTFITLAFLNFHPLYHVLFEGVSRSLLNAVNYQIGPQAMARGAARMRYLLRVQAARGVTTDTSFNERYRYLIENNRTYPGTRTPGGGRAWSQSELNAARSAISFSGITGYAACNMDLASRAVDQGANATNEITGMTGSARNNTCQSRIAKGFGADTTQAVPNSGGKTWWEAFKTYASNLNPATAMEKLGNAISNSLLFIIVWIAQLILTVVIWCIMFAVIFVKNIRLVFAPLAMTFYMWQKTEGMAIDWFKGHMTILLLVPMLAFTMGMASVLMWLMSETGGSQGLFLSFVMIIGVVAVTWKTKDIAATFGTNFFSVISSTAGAITGAVSVAAGTALTGGLALGKVAGGAATGGFSAGKQALAAARNANGTGGGLAKARNAMAAARGAVSGATRGGISTALDGEKMKTSIKAGQKFSGAAKQALDVNNPGIVPNYAEFATDAIEAGQKAKAKREQKKQDKQKNPDNGVAATFAVKGGAGKVPAKPSEILNEKGESQFDAEAKRLGVNGKAVDAAKVFADRAAENGMAETRNWIEVEDFATKQKKIVATAEGNAKHERLINPASPEYDEDYAWAAAALAASEGAGREADPIKDPHLMHFAGEKRGGGKAPGWARNMFAGETPLLGDVAPRKATFAELIQHGKGAAVALSAAKAHGSVQQRERQRQAQRANEAGTLLEQGSLSDIAVRASADNVTRNHGDPKAQQRVFNALTNDDNIRATVVAFMDDPNGNAVGQQKLKSMTAAQLNRFIADATHSGAKVQEVDGLADYAADYAAKSSQRAAIKVEAEVLVNRDGQFGLDVARQVGQNTQPMYTAQKGSTLDLEWQRRNIARADHTQKAAVVDQMRDAMASAYGDTYDRVAADVKKQINEQLFLYARATP